MSSTNDEHESGCLMSIAYECVSDSCLEGSHFNRGNGYHLQSTNPAADFNSSPAPSFSHITHPCSIDQSRTIPLNPLTSYGQNPWPGPMPTQLPPAFGQQNNTFPPQLRSGFSHPASGQHSIPPGAYTLDVYTAMSQQWAASLSMPPQEQTMPSRPPTLEPIPSVRHRPRTWNNLHLRSPSVAPSECTTSDSTSQSAGASFPPSPVVNVMGTGPPPSSGRKRPKPCTWCQYDRKKVSNNALAVVL